MLELAKDLIRSAYRNYELQHPDLRGKALEYIMNTIKKIQRLHYADLPAKLDIYKGKNLQEAITGSLGSRYLEVTKLDDINDQEKTHYNQILIDRGFNPIDYDLEFWRVNNEFKKVYEDKITLISKNPEIPYILLFSKDRIEESGIDKIVNRSGILEEVNYYWGPTDIVVHNNHDVAFNMASLPMWSNNIRIAINLPIADTYITDISLTDKSFKGSLHRIYSLPLIATPKYTKRLSQFITEGLKIPLVVLAHELGHAEQTDHFRSDMFPDDAEKQEMNATYFALRLTRRLKDSGIDISNKFNNSQLISILERAIFLHDGGDENRLKRKTGLIRSDVI